MKHERQRKVPNQAEAMAQTPEVNAAMAAFKIRSNMIVRYSGFGEIKPKFRDGTTAGKTFGPTGNECIFYGGKPVAIREEEPIKFNDGWREYTITPDESQGPIVVSARDYKVVTSEVVIRSYDRDHESVKVSAGIGYGERGIPQIAPDGISIEWKNDGTSSINAGGICVEIDETGKSVKTIGTEQGREIDQIRVAEIIARATMFADAIMSTPEWEEQKMRTGVVDPYTAIMEYDRTWPGRVSNWKHAWERYWDWDRRDRERNPAKYWDPRP